MSGVQRVRKKPVEVQAVQFTEDADANEELFEWLEAECPDYWYDDSYDQIVILTLEGSMRASVGDYIIRGVQGEFYPCKPDIFAKTYDIVDPIGMLEPHKITFTYTTDDDGIHLTCSCGFDKLIGHAPTVADIALATTDHLDNPEGNPS